MTSKREIIEHRYYEDEEFHEDVLDSVPPIDPDGSLLRFANYITDNFIVSDNLGTVYASDLIELYRDVEGLRQFLNKTSEST